MYDPIWQVTLRSWVMGYVPLTAIHYLYYTVRAYLPNAIQTPKRIQVAVDSVTIRNILISTDASGIHGMSGVRKWSSASLRGWRTITIKSPSTQIRHKTVIVTAHHSPACSRLQAFTISKQAADQITTKISRVTITIRLVRAVGLQFHTQELLVANVKCQILKKNI